MNRHERRGTKLKQRALYQVFVDDDGLERPVSPQFNEPDAAGRICEAINLAVLQGKLRPWGNAHVVQVLAD